MIFDPNSLEGSLSQSLRPDPTVDMTGYVRPSEPSAESAPKPVPEPESGIQVPDSAVNWMTGVFIGTLLIGGCSIFLAICWKIAMAIVG